MIMAALCVLCWMSANLNLDPGGVPLVNTTWEHSDWSQEIHTALPAVFAAARPACPTMLPGSTGGVFYSCGLEELPATGVMGCKRQLTSFGSTRIGH